ncbi:MAG TPA: RluA family pseudouridine synthase [Chitinophagales bacterium]|nr:RluA family pseudouridine synthase [Chitinophagales bacterium]HNL83913.1 RluA family pseudouridine synthase [Chitinophagales bacterium]
MSIDILYEDNHLLALNKNSGDIVQADITGDAPVSDEIKAYLKSKYTKPGNVFLGVIHRLDRPVSGAVLFARTSKGLSKMNELFKTKAVKKTYWAVVKNKPPKNEDTLVHYHIKDEKAKRARLFDKEVAHSKICKLHYSILCSSDNYHLLEIQLETGRFHQIRAQLAKIGSPIKGDIKYGFDRPNEDKRSIHLHARRLDFLHPVKQEPVSITAPVPKEKLWQYFEEKLKT